MVVIYIIFWWVLRILKSPAHPLAVDIPVGYNNNDTGKRRKKP